MQHLISQALLCLLVNNYYKIISIIRYKLNALYLLVYENQLASLFSV